MQQPGGNAEASRLYRQESLAKHACDCCSFPCCLCVECQHPPLFPFLSDGSGFRGTAVYLAYPRAAEWSVQQFVSCFSVALDACLPLVDFESSHKLAFDMFGCRDIHVDEHGQKHWCFSVLVRFADMLRFRDVRTKFALPGLCDQVYVCSPSTLGRPQCGHADAGVRSFLQSAHSWISAAPVQERFGDPFFCWACSQREASQASRASRALLGLVEVLYHHGEDESREGEDEDGRKFEEVVDSD